MEELTRGEKACFKYLVDRATAPPSIKEMAEHFRHQSPATVQHWLGQLKAKGFIDWEPGKARTWRILKGGELRFIPEDKLRAVDRILKGEVAA